MDAEVRAEMKKVVRLYERYSSEQRADMQASHRLGFRQRQSLGKYFYIHPEVPGVCYETRSGAAIAGLSKREQTNGQG